MSIPSKLEEPLNRGTLAAPLVRGCSVLDTVAGDVVDRVKDMVIRRDFCREQIAHYKGRDISASSIRCRCPSPARRRSGGMCAKRDRRSNGSPVTFLAAVAPKGSA